MSSAALDRYIVLCWLVECTNCTDTGERRQQTRRDVLKLTAGTAKVFARIRHRENQQQVAPL